MNRQQRRQAERKGAKVGLPAPRPPKPTGHEFGVEVDCVDEGVVFTVLLGLSTFTVLWSHQDALEVAKMLTAAGNKSKAQAVEVVRSSGLVVPPAGMQL